MIKHRIVYPMRSSSPGTSDPRNSLISLLLGFFGVTAAFLLLPKTIKYVIRRFFLSILSEVVAVVITGLLTEKLVDVIGQDASDAHEIEPRH